MKHNPDLKTPWHRSGLLHSPGRPKSVNSVLTYPNVGEWRTNPVFEATIKLVGTERGTSAAYFRWRVVTSDHLDLVDTVLPMFITDVGHVLMLGLAKPGGTISSRFFVVKRGQNYGITPVQPAEDVPPRGQERPTETTGAPSGS